MDRLVQAFFPIAYAQTFSYKTAFNKVWMYGLGGTGDILTEVAGYPYDKSAYAWWTFKYNFSYAQMMENYAYCLPKSYGTGWRHYGCWNREMITTSFAETRHLVEGNFYFINFDNYRHQLYNGRGGTSGGTATAWFGFTGQVPGPVTNHTYWSFQSCIMYCGV
jgi:hypothetical protein